MGIHPAFSKQFLIMLSLAVDLTVSHQNKEAEIAKFEELMWKES